MCILMNMYHVPIAHIAYMITYMYIYIYIYTQILKELVVLGKWLLCYGLAASVYIYMCIFTVIQNCLILLYIIL